MSEYKVYIIHASKRTYVGITKNFPRRLRQHNGEIKGGARYTRKAADWKLRCLIHGFRTDTQARQLEWRLHHPVRRNRAGNALTRRLKDLHDCLRMKRWTTTCDPVSEIKGLRVELKNLETDQLEWLRNASWPESAIVSLTQE